MTPNTARMPAPAKNPAPLASFETFVVTSALASSISSRTRSCALVVTSLTISPSCFSAPGGVDPLLVIVAPEYGFEDLREDKGARERARSVYVRLLGERVLLVGGDPVGLGRRAARLRCLIGGGHHSGGSSSKILIQM